MLRIESSAFKSDGKTSTQQRDITVTANSQRGHVQQLSESQMSQFPGSVSSDCPRPRCGYPWTDIDRYLTDIVGQF